MDHQVPHAKSQLSDMSDELLVRIFKPLHLKYMLRLGMVSKRFNRLAAAATSSVTLAFADELDPFQQWLQHHADDITQLDVSDAWSATAFAFGGEMLWHALPCNKLQQLQLSKSWVQLAPSHTHPGLLQHCSSLTSLSLQDSLITDLAAALAAIPVLSQLQRLDLSVVVGESRNDAAPLPGCVLSQTLQLTHLRLAGNVCDDTLAHLGCCRGLQQLTLDLNTTSTCTVSGLGPIGKLAGLKQLVLRNKHGTNLLAFEIDSGSTPWLRQLTALQSLEVRSLGVLTPSLLQDMASLTSLLVVDTPLSAGLTGVQSLLEVLSRLPDMRKLVLTGSLQHRAAAQQPGGSAAAAPAAPAAPAAAPASDLVARWLQIWILSAPPAPPPPPPVSAYAALTASSNLQHLDLMGCQLPAGVLGHLFRPGLQLPQLRVLNLCNTGAAPRNAADLDRVITCCPNLCELGVTGASVENQLTSLSRLTRLTSLTLAETGRRGPDSLTGLVQLERLILRPCYLWDEGVLQLSVLTSLTELQVAGSRLSEALTRQKRREYNEHLEYNCSVKPIDAPDNYRYEGPRRALRRVLLEDCMASTRCRQTLAGHFFANEQLLHDDGIEIAMLGKQVAALKIQRAEWQQQKAGLKQQLQQERQRVASLQEQVAELADCEDAVDHLTEQLVQRGLWVEVNGVFQWA